MKGKLMFDAMDQIEPSMIEIAEKADFRRHQRRWVGIIAAAVPVLLLSGALIWHLMGTMDVQVPTPETAVPDKPMQEEEILPEADLTREQVMEEIQKLDAMYEQPTDISMEAIQNDAPALFSLIRTEYETVSFYLFQELLPELWCWDQTHAEPPALHTQRQCAVLRSILEEYDSDTPETARYRGLETWEWILLYINEASAQFRSQNYDLNASYYEAHPVEKQGLIVMLQIPEMHLRLCTEVLQPIYDELIWMDAGNAMITMFETNEITEQLSLRPESASLADLCNETTKWTLSQAEDLSVTLHIKKSDGQEVQVTWMRN